MLAKSPNSAGLVLVAAVSGRALAQAARRAGYRVRVADFFCDEDTMVAAEKVTTLPGSLRDGVDAERLFEVLGELAQDAFALTGTVGGSMTAARQVWSQPSWSGVDALVLGSGFERLPDLIDELALRVPLAGNSGRAIRGVKDPAILAADCASLGIQHPPLCSSEPADPENWISKRVGGAGGAHIRRGEAATHADGRYFQRRIQGQSISALFVADGAEAHLVGFSRQWTSPTPEAPYRYGGAVRLPRFDREDGAMIGGWLSGLTLRAGLVGLCSADFIRDRNGYHLIEINPRPGATLDIFDSPNAPLMQAHVNACRGQAFELPRFADSMASLIAYAEKPVLAFPEFDWPEWAADRQSVGSRLSSGDPVCTIFARGRSAAEATRRACANLAQLERAWGGGRP